MLTSKFKPGSRVKLLKNLDYAKQIPIGSLGTVVSSVRSSSVKPYSFVVFDCTDYAHRQMNKSGLTVWDDELESVTSIPVANELPQDAVAAYDYVMDRALETKLICTCEMYGAGGLLDVGCTCGAIQRKGAA